MDLFDDADIVYSYSRAEAISDGVLVDIDDRQPTVRAEAGISVPVALTSTLWAKCVTVPEGDSSQDEKGRLWDIIFSFIVAAKGARQDTLYFKISVKNEQKETVTIKAVIGPGDNGEHVITMMFPNED